MTAVLTFMLLLAYVIISALNEKKTPDYTDGDEDSLTVCNDTGGSSSSRDMDGLKCQAKEFCSVTCTGFIVSDNITDHINEATKNVTIPKLFITCRYDFISIYRFHVPHCTLFV